MRKRTQNNTDEKRLFSLIEGTCYTGLGATTFRAWAQKIGAVRKIGSRVLFDKAVIDRELDQKEAHND